MAIDLKRVSELANLLVTQIGKQAEAEAALKEIKATVFRIEREDLPTLMAEVGLKSVKLESGLTVEIKDEVDAAISAKNFAKARAWLVKHGFEGIIKTTVGIDFPKGQHDIAVEVAARLTKEYPGVAFGESIHAATLKSFVKERLEEGDAIPFDIFGIFPYSKAVVKK